MKKHIWCCDNDTFKWEHDGKKFCLHIRSDECARNPREEWDNLCLMACFHRRYRLGDDIKTSDPEEFWRDLVAEHIMGVDLVDAVRSGEVDGMKIEPIEDNPECVSLMMRWCIKGDGRWGCEAIDDNPYDLSSEILSNLTVGNCQKLLEPYCEWMPLWLYDHGGITISCGARTRQYADRWDSGCVGWIVAMKDKIMQETTEILRGEDGEPIRVEYKHEGGPSTYGVMSRPLTDETWRKRAIEVMEGEVEVYDQYLRGEVYGYTLYEQQEDEWVEQESCLGFYGDDLLENGIADEAGEGFADALKNDAYEQGKATVRTVTCYDFG
jgi:hypothetical protein